MNSLLKILSTKRWVGVILIMLTGVIAYHNCLPNEMFWDDDDFINNNRFIRDFHYWPLWFSQNLVAGSYLVSNYWRPLLLLSLLSNGTYGTIGSMAGMPLLSVFIS